MIFDIVTHVTLMNLTEMECVLLLLLKSYLFLCLSVLEYLTFNKSKEYLWI